MKDSYPQSLRNEYHAARAELRRLVYEAATGGSDPGVSSHALRTARSRFRIAYARLNAVGTDPHAADAIDQRPTSDALDEVPYSDLKAWLLEHLDKAQLIDLGLACFDAFASTFKKNQNER